MNSNLFDKNGVEIKIGDKYITSSENSLVYTVLWKGGAFCGGITYEEAIPLVWEVDCAYNLEISDDLSWLELITTNEL